MIHFNMHGAFLYKVIYQWGNFNSESKYGLGEPLFHYVVDNLSGVAAQTVTRVAEEFGSRSPVWRPGESLWHLGKRHRKYNP
jgi:hypothetical protein